MSIEPTLSARCRSFRKRQYDENNNDEQIQSPKKSSIIFFLWLLI